MLALPQGKMQEDAGARPARRGRCWERVLGHGAAALRAPRAAMDPERWAVGAGEQKSAAAPAREGRWQERPREESVDAARQTPE